jgi:hypothetical protein
MSTEGWPIYPRNLPTADSDQWIYDLGFYTQKLSLDSSRVFVGTDEETYLQITHCGEPGRLDSSIYKGWLIGTLAERLEGAEPLERCLDVRRMFCHVPHLTDIENKAYQQRGSLGCRIM